MSNNEILPFYRSCWNLDSWQKYGFDSYGEAEYWQKSCCGILCLKMGIDYLLLKVGLEPTLSIAEYIKLGVSLGAYTRHYGWSQEGLVRIANHLGAKAHLHTGIDLNKIDMFLDKKSILIMMIKSKEFTEFQVGDQVDKNFGAMTLVVDRNREGEIGYHVLKNSLEKGFMDKKLVERVILESEFSGNCVEVENDVKGIKFDA